MCSLSRIGISTANGPSDQNMQEFAGRSLTMFMWGYEGWGSTTKRFVEAVDAVEAGRGFASPRFVDIRIRRNVRAVGFRGDTFKKAVGTQRYRWMKSLGNLGVLRRSGPRIQIADPSAANTLLDDAIGASRHAQRILFFCHCLFPGDCHRSEVADLLHKAAKRRNVRLTVVEWPGGEPASVPIDISTTVEQSRKLRSGQRSIPLGRNPALERYAAVPWASVVRVHGGSEELLALTGPARYRGKSWYLPLPWETARSEATVEAMRREASHIRRKFSFQPHTS